MLVDLYSYIGYMLRVYGVLCVLLFVIPLSMWKVYLAKKSLGEKFLFCLITQTAFLVNIVLLLGFLEICTPYTLTLSIALEYCLVRWTYSDRQFFKRLRGDMELVQQVIQRRKTRSYLWRVLLGRALNKWRDIRRSAAAAWKTLYHRKGEIIFLLVVCGYNILFLTHNLYIYHSYQFPDTPVHLSWGYELEHGTLFYAGIYPFAMHCMLFTVRVLSGIPLREVVLYYGAFQTVMLILSMYLLARRVFKWKWTPCLVMVFFSIMLNQGRYGASLPQECGMFASASMFYYLLGYLRQRREKHIVQGDSKLRSIFRINQYLTRKSLDYNFWMLVLSVSLIISFHFYTAIAAILLAVAVVSAHFTTFFKKQYLVPIVAAALAGAMITLLPFAACFAKGIPFQESMNWAMSVIEGKEWEGTGSNYQELIEAGGVSDGKAGGEAKGQALEVADEDKIISVFKRGLSGKEILLEYLNALLFFEEGYLFNKRVTPIVVTSLVIAIGAMLVCLTIRPLRAYGKAYAAVLIYLFLIATLGTFPLLGLMVIFESTRAAVFAQPYLFFLLAIPFDALFGILSLWHNPEFRKLLTGASWASYVAVCLFLVQNNYLHNYFDVNLAYYNEPDYLINYIKNNYPNYVYNIVSPTDELYAVRGHSYHYELSEFIAMVEGNQPPKKFDSTYLFFFIEKYSLQDEKYGQDLVSPEYARERFIYTATTQDYYFQRNVLESKAYYWARAMEEIYPNQMSVFFENDIYICFILRQDTNCPLDMRIDYLSFMEEDET